MTGRCCSAGGLPLFIKRHPPTRQPRRAVRLEIGWLHRALSALCSPSRQNLRCGLASTSGLGSSCAGSSPSCRSVSRAMNTEVSRRPLSGKLKARRVSGPRARADHPGEAQARTTPAERDRQGPHPADHRVGIRQPQATDARLEEHLAKTPPGLAQRIVRRLLALTLGIYLNILTGRPPRTLAAYDGR